MPSGRLIEDQLRRIIRTQGWALLDCRINHFERFKDVYGFIASDEVLSFVVSDGSSIEVAALPADQPISAAAFHPGSTLGLTGLSGLTRVLARTTATGCVSENAMPDSRIAPPPGTPTSRT